MVPIKYNVRNLIVRKTTTLSAAFGLSLVVFVFASALMMGNGIKRAFGRSASADVAIVLRKGSNSEGESAIADDQVNLVKAQAMQVNAGSKGGSNVAPDPEPKAARVSPSASEAPTAVGEIVVVVRLERVGATGGSNVTVRGMPENGVKFYSSAKLVDGRMPNPGTDEVLIGAGLRGRFQGMTIGKTFDLKKNRPATVVGVFSDDGSSHESEVWADIHSVGQAFGREGYVSSVRVRLASPSRFDAFRGLVESNPQLSLSAMRESDYYEKQSDMTATFLTGLGIMIAVFFSLGAMIGAMITMHAQVANRQREIGTLRALGFSRLGILTSFLFESTVLSFLGGVVGAVASLAMQLVRITTLNQTTWSEIVFTFEPTPSIIVGALGLAAIMGLIGGFLPAFRAANVSPIEAMRA